MKKTLLTCALLSVMISLIGQKNVDYKVLVDDPDQIKPIYVAFDILTADTWNASSMMGICLRGEYLYKGLGSINADIKRPYFSMNRKNLDGENIYRGYRSNEIGINYNVFSSIKEKAVPVIISSKTIYSQESITTFTSYMDSEAKVKSIFQARLGIQSLSAPIWPAFEYDKYHDPTDYRYFHLEKGEESHPIGFGGGSDGPSRPYSFQALMKVNMLYAGVSYRTLKNLWLESSEGLLANTKDYNLFFDLLFGKPKYEDVRYLGKTDLAVSQYELVNTKEKNMGWRLGFEAKMHQNLALTYKVELGSRPGYYDQSTGILAPNAYILLSAGYGFGMGKKI
jgi:hypothetical protein